MHNAEIKTADGKITVERFDTVFKCGQWLRLMAHNNEGCKLWVDGNQVELRSESFIFLPTRAMETIEQIKRNVKTCVQDLMWISGNEKENTSAAVGMRWSRLKQHMAFIRKPGDSHSETMMARLEPKILEAHKDIDRSNIRYDGEDPTDHFKYDLVAYGDVIIDELKKFINPSETEALEDL